MSTTRPNLDFNGDSSPVHVHYRNTDFEEDNNDTYPEIDPDMGNNNSSTKISSKTDTDLDYSQWQVGPNGKFRPAAQTIAKLHPGVYKIEQDEIGLFLQSQTLISDNIVELPDTANVHVLDGMKTFWQRKDRYEKYGFVYKRGVLLWGPPGCHSAGTEVIMFDGTTKKVEDVIEGDLLMGPDSLPRTVEALCRGRDDMFRVFPSGKHESFDVNGNHFFSLYNKATQKTVETKVNNFLELSKVQQQHYCLWKPNNNKQKSLHTRIKKIESLGIQDYYGFQLSGDHLYLLKSLFVMVNSGKSITLNLLMKELISLSGIVLLCGNPEWLVHMMQRVRQMEPERPIIVVLEDLDEIIEKYGEHTILSMLDGENQISNIVYVATTNFPLKLGPRIINRPSRFDERIFVGMPSSQARKAYLKHSAKDLDEVTINKWVADTKGFSIAHLRELVAACYCLDQKYDDIMQRLNNMTKQPKSVDGFLKGAAGFNEENSNNTNKD